MEKEEAMKILKDFHDKSALFSVRTALETLHPELAESEDEKTRKRIIALVNAHGQGMYKDDMLAWLENIPYTIDHEKREGFHLGYKAGLEKQGEQKPACSDDKKLTDVNHEYFNELLENNNSKDINDYAYQVAYCMSHDWIEETATWDDIQKACKLGAEWNKRHYKSNWSEEDEAHINGIIDYLLDYKLLVYEEDTNVANGVQKELDWLETLKQRIGGKV